jgi:preprotein translocase subunit YajC
MGASLNYLLSCSILFVLFASILIFVILRKKRQK